MSWPCFHKFAAKVQLCARNAKKIRIIFISRSTACISINAYIKDALEEKVVFNVNAH